MSTALHLLIWITALIPRAVGLPDTVGPNTPFSGAGVGAMIGNLIRPDASANQRGHFARRWTLLGLCAGGVLYGFAVTYQLLSKS